MFDIIFIKLLMHLVSGQSTVFQDTFNYVTQNYHDESPDELHDLISFGYIIYLMTDG